MRLGNRLYKRAGAGGEIRGGKGRNARRNKYSKRGSNGKKQISYSARKQMGLKARPEDDEIVREIMQLLAQKGITVERACKVLKDVRTLLPRFAKLL